MTEKEINVFKTKEFTATKVITKKRSDTLIKKEIKEVFQKQWLLKREVLSLSHTLSKLKNELMGLKDLEEQLKEQYGEQKS